MPRTPRPVVERVLETADRLEREMAQGAPSPARLLRVVREDGSAVVVTGDRWLIGRGSHCDLVLDGAKISREHAAVVRDADGRWCIEDLGSSNGTWYLGERIARHRIEPGDELFLCAERIRFELA